MLKKITIGALIIVVIGLLYWRGLNSPADKNGANQKFIINQGETVSQIAGNLRTNNLISSPLYFKYEVWRSGQKLQAGEYSISPKLSTSEIIKILSQGEIANPDLTIRIIEGWSIKDINNYLNKNKIVAGNSFAKAAAEPTDQNLRQAYGLPDNAGLEGFLFPDTYRIDKNATAQYIINKMLANFDKKLSEALRQEIKRQNKSAYEIITMASILEKEVRTPEDMKVASGIFWDRIKYGIALRSDATLSYVLEDKIDGHTIEQTKIDSPYNTYKYRGLPPGPICNPGLNAIMAAIYPTSTDYNYFLTNPKTGRTIFSRTLNEHNANKNSYLK